MAKKDNKKDAKKTKKEKKAKKVSYHRQPEDLSLRDWQLALRRQYGQNQAYRIANLGEHPVWSDFTVNNPESKTSYLVAIRGTETGDNFCQCLDFRTNTLGTCKHIEWALEKLRNTWGNKQHFKQAPVPPAHTYLRVDYTDAERKLQLVVGPEQEKALQETAKKYFTAAGQLRANAWLKLDQFIEKARGIDPNFVVYPDALDLIIERRGDARRAKTATRLAAKKAPLAGLVKADLYPYQQEGALFVFRAGRALLADEMGLGKTLQAITAAELMRREAGISSAIIICPTSLKYQWRSEIERFTDSKALVIEGSAGKRREQYLDQETFYKILTYNVVARDYPYLNAANPDLVILDEAQRIKNYHTKIAHAVKRLNIPSRIAITGTPLENKLEDIYSIVQFLDQHKLGPLWKLQARHEARDAEGIIRGYRHLDEIHAKLADVMIRRRKKEVAKQLPKRIDQNFLVPMTAEQQALHDGYNMDLVQLIAKWRRHGFLHEKDRQRLMSLLTLMRMSCDSTFLVDQVTRKDTKIAELLYILEERLTDPEEKVVIFSQWERMTRIVAMELDERGIPYASLHGGVPSEKRGDLLDRFREDNACRIFLSTDAGGVGLNLQRAALVVNLDLPWNPAVLEQRIARVHRLGQKRGVQVINLISEGTIEHRMVHTLRFKSSLAEAVLDTAADSVFMSDRKFSDFMENLERIQDAPVAGTSAPAGQPAPAEEDWETSPGKPAAGQPESAEQTTTEQNAPESTETAPTNPPARRGAAATNQPERPASQPEADKEPDAHLVADPDFDWQREDQPEHRPVSPTPAAQPASLVADGMSFLGRLAATLADEQATNRLVSEITERDEKTGQTYLKIPVEGEAVVSGVLKLLGGLLGKG